MESIDDHLVRRLSSLSAPHDEDEEEVDPGLLLRYFDAQIQARHLDLALRWLQSRKEGFYTIGSSGHESNAAVALALRPTDPALLHYRSGGFYAARAGQVDGSTPITDVLLSAVASRHDPISGGRHKVFGHRALNIIPQTSTIASHLPRAMGLAFALGRGSGRYPPDSVVVTSFGDASVNHSTAAGAFNAVGYGVHQGLPMPLLLVCEDNGIGISTRSPRGWVRRVLSSLPGISYAQADGTDPVRLLAVAASLVERVRTTRTPAVLHLGTVRFMGHAGSDAELAYRSRSEIVADHASDPILATATVLARRAILSPAESLDRYESVRKLVMDEARLLVGRVERLADPAAVTAPLTGRRRAPVSAAAARAGTADARNVTFGGRLPETRGPLTLAQSINATLHDALLAWPNAQVFGEDVARKGGVYGVTRGLRAAFGGSRVFDTLLDEQSILGLALGGALAGTLPVPEIQYLAYLHNAEDQLRGEAASLRFFSNGQYQNGMVVRIAGLAYQKGFGGHFHNDNSVAVLRDIPGLALAVASHPASAPALLRQCLALADQEGRVCVFLEPIALYHTRDLLAEGDGGWLATYAGPADWAESPLGGVRTVRDGGDLTIVTFGNGVPMSLRAADGLAHDGVDTRVIDLQWLAPLPTEGLRAAVDGASRVLVVDETRASGGVSDAVVATLVETGFTGRVTRVTSVDSYVPLGPAADRVLLGEADILRAARALLR